MYNLLFWISVQLILLWLLGKVTLPYRNSQVFKIVFAPQLLLVTLFRLVACCLSARRVDKMEFFEDQKPFLEEGQSRASIFGLVIFLLVLQGGIYYFFHNWSTTIYGLDAYALILPQINPGDISEGLVQIDARSYGDGLAALVSATDWQRWEVWFFFYLVSGLFPFMTLTIREVRYGASVVGVLALLTAVLSYLGFRPGFLSRGWWLHWWTLPAFFRVYSLYVTLLAATLILHFAARMACRAVSTKLRAAAAAKEKSRPTPARKRTRRQVETAS